MFPTSGSKYNFSPNIKTRSYNKSKPLLKCSKLTTNKNSSYLNKSNVNSKVTNSTDSEVKTPNNATDKSIQKLTKNSATYNSVAVPKGKYSLSHRYCIMNGYLMTQFKSILIK